jgi:YesN/AraC family two-component response regulator
MIANALPGYAVTLAKDGAEALRIVDHETPHMIILDLGMPTVDGFAVLDVLRARPHTQHIPVLVLSARVLSATDVRRLDHAGVTFHSKDILTQDEAAAVLQRALYRTDTLPQQTSGVVRRAVAYLQHNYARPLAREEIAQAVGVSKNYLSQIFQQELGISPWDYLNRYRVIQAKELLRTTGESITTIAVAVGFDDASYFGRVFHQHAGQSPRAYRAHACAPKPDR